MVSLARSTLFHDKVRFAVTLTGIIFAIILIVVQLGLFIGFSLTTSGVIDHSGADIWVASKGVPFLEVAVPFPERKMYQLLSLPGVEKAEKLIIQLGSWKRTDGVEQGIVLVGFDTASNFGGPWDVTAGRARDLSVRDAVFIDELYCSKLGVSGLGNRIEVNGVRARVSGFTRRIRSFTTSPYVFTSFKNAQRYARLSNDQTMYVLVKARPGVDLQELKRAIAGRVSGVDVYTTAEFSRRTQIYWMFTTGAGFGILIAALMGLIVGVVVVSQTIYATTMDHIKEFGTLKAIGASSRYIHGVLIRQAVWSALIGYAFGIAGSYAVVWVARDSGVALLLPWQLSVAMLVLTVMMCITASMISIKKVNTLDPGMVFK
jgi:putative ABC transport system permease protein